jgi:RNA polymerase sigma factor (sigma-70 family)
MALAFANRSDPRYLNILMGHFEQFANYFASQFAIKPSEREDIKQEAIIVAVKALEKYNPSKSTPFSYFYKVFHTAFLYHLRKNKMKRDHRPQTCSIEAFSDIKGQEDVVVYEENLITINGHILNKDEVPSKVKEATKFVKKIIKSTSSGSQKREIAKHPDPFVRDFSLRYLEKHRKRCKE